MSLARPPRPAHTLFQVCAHDFMNGVGAWSGGAGTAWPLANLALFVPFSVSVPCTAFEGWVSTGATAGGNFDIGVYGTDGTRLTSSGATARTVSINQNTTTMTDLNLVPDRWYYMAMAADSTNNYIATVAVAGLQEAQGVCEMAAAYVLPASATLAKTTRAYLPQFGLNFRTTAL